MNLFILDEDFTFAAQAACDRHVVKMPLETAQMLSTAHHSLDPDNPINYLLYKPTHLNHPCSKWVRENISNYVWTYLFWQAQCDEFTFRYGKTHLSYSKYAEIFATPPANIPFGKQTPFALAMPEQYQSNDPVQSYRDYYLNEKSHLLTYTRREPPYWIHAEECIQHG